MSEPHSAPTTTRRGFLGTLTVLLGGAIAALASVPVLGSLLSPLRSAQPLAAAEPPIPVGSINDFVVGTPRRVELIRSVTDAWSRSEASTIGAAWLTRNADNSFTAFSTICPHLGCGVNLDKPRGHFACPCHTSAFSMDGKRLEGPSPRDMDKLTVEVRGQAVLVHYRRFKVGTPERVEV